MGKEFALELARKGFNIVLISRNPEKLEQVTKEIMNANKCIQTRSIAIDFSKDLPLDVYISKMKELEDLRI
jgi:17beta-estradiol 17-dehydrogenase / very-long-chain 3-oxoacyl-CoA reductase